MRFLLYLCLTLVMSFTLPQSARAELSLLGGLGAPLVDFPVGNFNDVEKFGAGLQLKYLNPVAPAPRSTPG